MDARIINIDDASLSVYDAGSGKSIVFLHGNASRWQHWEPQLQVLSNQFRCIAFDAPALVIAGELDPAAPPATLKQLAEKLQNATYLEFPETGHYLNIEESEAFTAAIIRFIEEHPPHR